MSQNLIFSTCSAYVRCQCAEFCEECVEDLKVQSNMHGGGSVMVWGCITGDENVEVNGRMDRFQYLEILERLCYHQHGQQEI